MSEQQQTFGQKTVRVSFNPSKFPEVDLIKELAAQLIDQLQVGRTTTDIGEKKRLYSEAITSIQGGCMWGVSAATYEE